MSTSRASSLQSQPVISFGNNGNAVQDILFFLKDTDFDRMKEKGHFNIWLEQLSWMLLLQSHRRVPDCETLSAQQSRSSSPLSTKKPLFFNATKRNSSSSKNQTTTTNPLIRYSVIASPDDSSVEAARSLHSELSQHFFNDDAHRHLVDIDQTITCHRSLSAFYPDPKKKKITLADISAPSSTSTSRAHSPSYNNVNNNNDNNIFSFGAKVKTMGINPDASTETLDSAKDRLLDFFMNLVGSMDPSKIHASPLREKREQQQQQQQMLAMNKNNKSNKKDRTVRDSDSDSSSEESDDEDDDASFRLDDDVSDKEEDEDHKIGKAALSCRQVIFIVCNDFCYENFSERCNVTNHPQNVVVNNGDEKKNQQQASFNCFMWARSRGQYQWYSPPLWNEDSSMNMVSSNATPKLLPAEATPPPASASLLMMNPSSHQENKEEATKTNTTETTTADMIMRNNPLENVVNNPNAINNNNSNNHINNTSATALVDQSIAFVEEEPNPSKPISSNNNNNIINNGSNIVRGKSRSHSQQQEEEFIKSPSKQFHQMTASTTFKSPSAEKEFRLEEGEDIAITSSYRARRSISSSSAADANNNTSNKLGSVEKEFTEEELSTNVMSMKVIPPVAAKEKKMNENEDDNAFTSSRKPSFRTSEDVYLQHSSCTTNNNNNTPRYALATKASSMYDRRLQKQQQEQEQQKQNSRNSSSSVPKRTISPITNTNRMNTHEAASTVTAPLRRSSPTISTKTSTATSRASSQHNNNSNTGSRKPSPVPRQQSRPSSVVGHFQKRSGEKASEQLYTMGTYALKRKKELERIELEKKRQQEEEEARKFRQPHPHLSMHEAKDAAERKRVKSKIIHALRADPNSEEGLVLLPNLSEAIPSARLNIMVKRLAPPAPTISKREEQRLKLEEQRRNSSRGRSTSANNNSLRCSTPPPAWKGSGAVDRSVLGTPNNNKPITSSRRTSISPITRVSGTHKENTATTQNRTSSASSRTRSNSPSVLDRLYANRFSSKEAQQKQQQMADLREVEDIIETRKKSNPMWLKEVMKNPSLEDQYRKRLLRTRQEERRLAEQREHVLNRNPDPRYPPVAKQNNATAAGDNFTLI